MSPKGRQRDQAINALANSIFESMLEDLCMDAALRAHRELSLSQRPCNICHTRCGHALNPPLDDADDKPNIGSLVDVESKDGLVLVKCVNCEAKIASNRFAPHLSNCLGLATSRRGAARAATSKPSSDVDRFSSPAVASDSGTMSDDTRGGKVKNRSKAKRAEEAEFNLHRKRATPGDSPKKSQRHKIGAAGSLSRVPSKLRETSIASLDPEGDYNMSVASRDSSPDEDGQHSGPNSVVSQSPIVQRKNGGGYASPQASHTSTNPHYLNDDNGDETGSDTDSSSS